MLRLWRRLFGSRSCVSPVDDPNSFGNIALQRGYITKADLERALRTQETQAPLGEVLVGMGVLTELQKEEILHEQLLLNAEPKDRPALEVSYQRKVIAHVSRSIDDLTDHTKQFNRQFQEAVRKA